MAEGGLWLPCLTWVGLAAEKGDSRMASYPCAWEAKCGRKRGPPRNPAGSTQRAEGHQLLCSLPHTEDGPRPF